MGQNFAAGTGLKSAGGIGYNNLNAHDDLIVAVTGGDYVACAASTTTALGAAGEAGDVIHSLTIVPATDSPGTVEIKDGTGSAIAVFAGGASSVSTLTSFTVILDAASTAGGWSIVCGANVSAVAVGDFS